MKEGRFIDDIPEAYGVPIALTSQDSGGSGALPFIKAEDMQYFGRLAEPVEDESKLKIEEANERKIMAILLKIRSSFIELLFFIIYLIVILSSTGCPSKVRWEILSRQP